MQARYIWANCQFDMPLAGVTESAASVDCFWVTATQAEVTELITPSLDALQQHRYHGGLRDKVDDWLSPGKEFAAFLVARDKSRVLTLYWTFPTVDARAISGMVAIGAIGEDELPAGTAITSLDDLAALNP